MTPEEKTDFALDNLRFELEFMDDLNLLNAKAAVSYDFATESASDMHPERRRYLKARFGILENEILERMSGKRERAAIVADLRARADKLGEAGRLGMLLREVADRYERGEHIKESK